MNKMLLSPILFALITAPAHAADTLPQTQPGTSSPTTTPATLPVNSNAMPTASTADNINCNVHLPAGQTTVDATLITSWAEKATLQAFTFSPADLQNQMTQLQACFTDQGWKGFSDALDKSGNIESIKSQQLTVSSQADGEATVNTIKDNQWKVSLPIQVVYQNDKEKVTQRLNVEVLVGRKINGDLGIMQMIATTKPVQTPDKSSEDTSVTPTENQNPTANTAPQQPTAPTTAAVPAGTTAQPAQ